MFTFFEFSSKSNYLQAWYSYSLVLPILEYCCLNWKCKPFQLTTLGLRHLYHIPTSSTNVRQNLCTLKPCGNAWLSIQPFVPNKWAFASSSSLPEVWALYEPKLIICLVPIHYCSLYRRYWRYNLLYIRYWTYNRWFCKIHWLHWWLCR